MTNLEKLLMRLADAEAEVLKELERVYPVGCAIEYRLREGVEPQIGNVTRHIGGRDGEMRVQLAISKNGGRYETTLQYRKVIRRRDD